eukprot:3261000-Rhodomonas_salina.1
MHLKLQVPKALEKSKRERKMVCFWFRACTSRLRMRSICLLHDFLMGAISLRIVSLKTCVRAAT